jgi:hypothetical protein
MGNLNERLYQPNCMLAHGLINRLSIIVGYCDLLTDEEPEDSVCHDRLLKIREIANTAAEELGEHQCRLDTLLRESEFGSVSEVRRA